MGLVPQGPTKVDGSEEDLVYTEDPDVEVPAALEGCGWVLESECRAKKGADKVRTRILAPSEVRLHQGVVRDGGAWVGYAYALERAVLSVNGSKKSSVKAAFLDSLMLANGADAEGPQGRVGATAYELLALRVLARTNSKPISLYHKTARAKLGVDEPHPEPQPEGVAGDGETKSGG